MNAETVDLLLGQTLGGCVILDRLGEGGMATVYRARHEADNQIVAIKIILPKLANMADFVARFKREARLMLSLDHPHILPVYQFGMENGLIYLVMRLLEGGSLSRKIYAGQVSLSDNIRLIEQIASSLDYAHTRGIVHRDLKPSNVLLDLDGDAFLTDFGIAKWTEETSGLTATGMIVGTPSYMAPEQWRTEPVDPRTDVYALGVMIYEMLSGHMPFQADTPFSLMYKHLDEPPPAISQVRLGLSPAVDRVICRAMAKIPARRYSSAGALAASLKEALQRQDDEQWPDTRRAMTVKGIEQTSVSLTEPCDDGTTLLETGVERGVLDTALSVDREIYDSIDVGARTLLARAREAIREVGGETALLASAVITYVEDLREQVKRKLDEGRSPYKALESYDIADNRLFFGREKAIDAMLARSPFGRLTVLHAESGAGKTSLIRAGIMPRLLAGGFLPIYVTVRRQSPHEAIKRVLLPDPSTAPELANASLRSYLTSVAQTVGHNRELFIFIDQFETFFTDIFTDEQRTEFILELAECLDDQLLPVRFTLAMRTEYFGLLACFQPHVPQPFTKEFLLRPLILEEAQRALVLPVRAQEYDYEPEVVDLILHDLADASGEIAPPQLQLVGSALIEALPLDRKIITQHDYVQSGGAAGVLREYLERLLARLPINDRRLAQVVIESLVRGDQTRDVRGVESLRAELAVLGMSADRLEPVLQALRENHVLRVVEIEEGLAYELVHDYLATQIQVDPATVARKAAQELLDRRVRDYERYRSLLTRPELGVILSQRERLRLTDMAHTLITRSQAAQRHQRWIAATALIALVGVLLIGMVAAVRESQNRQERLQSALTAEARIKAQRDIAMTTESRMLADLAMQQLTIDPVASLNLGVQALTPRDRPYVPEAEFALSRAVQASNERVFMPSERRVRGAVWNTDESRVLTWSDDHTARIFDAQTGAELVHMADHESSVLTATWSPDETRILTGDYAGTAHIFDAQTGVLQTVMEGHTDHLRGATWRPDGRRVLTWADDGTARIWDAVSGNTIAILEGHARLPVELASWSPDGSCILTVGANYDVLIWDATTGQELRLLRGHVNRVRGAIWNADGSRVITYGDDSQAILWDAQSGAPLFTLVGHTDRVTSVSWSPDESRLVTTGFDGLVIVWDGLSGQELKRMRVGVVVDGAQWNSDGSRLLTFGEPGAVVLWDTATGQMIAALVGHGDTVYGAAWSTAETVVLTWSEDGTARVWNALSGQEMARMTGHEDALTSAHWSADHTRVLTSGADGSARIWAYTEKGVVVGHGEVQHLNGGNNGGVLDALWVTDQSYVVTAHQDGSIRLWDMATGLELQHFEGHTDQVELLRWSPEHTRILSGSVDGTARIWDIDTGESLTVMRHDAPIVWITWNADGSRVLTGSEDETARVWEAATGQEVLRLSGHAGTIASAVWSADETRILTASNDGSMRLWDATSGQMLLEVQVAEAPLLGAVWNGDETRLLVWGFDTMVHVYDAASGAELVRMQGHGDWVTSARWNMDETYVLTTSSDGTARLWDAFSGAELRRFEGHTDSVLSTIWNANQSRMLTWSADGTARVWDIASGQEVLRLTGHTARIRKAIWAADGTGILTASEDGTVGLWSAWPDLDSLLAASEQLITRPLSRAQRNSFFLSQNHSLLETSDTKHLVTKWL